MFEVSMMLILSLNWCWGVQTLPTSDTFDPLILCVTSIYSFKKDYFVDD